ncbi:MAG: 50S ribosomal protein L6 [Gammaproteobacteria bacterium]|jgi:large subunit ribosomal protein L6|nr:50S ribosomal protein L6 [Gammaproteobacteria bacterium]|tara:strand:- start:1966 stop:2499 length:534 start_codon:yes stop_codon:yes gene_type:complete
MARNINRPIQISEGVKAELKGQVLSFSGQKGSMELVVNDQVNVEASEENITFNPKEESKESIALTSTMRALAINKMIGVSKGFEKKLEINGVGYRVKVNGDSLELSLGFSHPVIYKLPEGVSAEAPTNTELVLTSADKQLLGDAASKIRSFRPPEPYKGKGVKYADERIIRKESKKA